MLIHIDLASRGPVGCRLVIDRPVGEVVPLVLKLAVD